MKKPKGLNFGNMLAFDYCAKDQVLKVHMSNMTMRLAKDRVAMLALYFSKLDIYVENSQNKSRKEKP